MQWFREAMSVNDAMPDYLTDLFFSSILPIYDHHQQLLVELEQRLASWYCFLQLIVFTCLVFLSYVGFVQNVMTVVAMQLWFSG